MQVLMWKPIPYGILQTCTATQLGCVAIRALDGWMGGVYPRVAALGSQEVAGPWVF